MTTQIALPDFHGTSSNVGRKLRTQLMPPMRLHIEHIYELANEWGVMPVACAANIPVHKTNQIILVTHIIHLFP